LIHGTAGVCGPELRKAFQGAYEGQNCKNSVGGSIMSGAGLARSVQGPHQQGEITRGGLQEKFLVYVPDTPDIEPVHAAGIELMREVAFDLFPALPL
jgi:hypothetical protein